MSAAILLLLAARRPLRHCFGAALAYQAWLIVPLVAIAALLPGRSAPQVPSLQVLQSAHSLAAQAAPAASPAQTDALLFAWAAGALASALWFIRMHRAFLRRAGRLTRRGDVYLSDMDIGPASVGLLRPRIVVPHDFEQCYTPSEQALVLAHERTHIARHDALANLAAAFLQCVFWFNPIVHLGVRRMRQDQELACDAVVMARHPQQRRVYAEALLKSHTGLAPSGAGIHCHWQSFHPTKERIMSLQHALPGTFRRLAGCCAILVLAAGAFGATLGARAETSTAPLYSVALALGQGAKAPENISLYFDAMERDDNDKESTVRILARSGESFSVASDVWRVDMTVRQADTPDQVWLAGKLYKNKVLVGSPTLLARLGEKATVRVDDDASLFR